MVYAYSTNDFAVDRIIADYTDNGFVLVENVISDHEKYEICEELKKINRGDYKVSEIEPVKKPLSDTSLLTRYMYIGQPHVLSKIIYKYIFHKNLTNILDHLVGANVPFWDGSYKCMQTMFVSKKPSSNGSPWHQDEHPIPTRDRSLIGVWLALEDATIENSCLWFIPESHQKGIIYERFEHSEPEVDSMPIARGFDDSTEKPIEMKAKSALFFSGYLLHSSKKNQSDNYRPALTIHYCTSSSYLPWHGESNYRGIVQVKGIDPYASQGYTQPVPWVRKE